jgi:hypothetical protein
MPALLIFIMIDTKENVNLTTVRWCKHEAMKSRLLILTVAVIVATLQGLAQQIPATQVTTLDDKRITLPVPGSKKPLLALVAFSRKGGDDTAAWNQHFKTNYEIDPRIDYVELADLQGVPSFVVSMIVHGMRRSVHEPERSHLAPFFSREDEWKKLVAETDPSMTYVVLANSGGHVVWQSYGPATDDKAAALESAILQLATDPRP